eukprot:CAMPEP_0172838888 /NCGR_PEP_ID=MMETSP1075-20121228/28184_1 /TAXON_ID=2916 /ORGANISM="Ceratium fusus, Strain PA161109" /LENGTH=385 /DNA_ID=CAMNT_0013682461 /DNA_START=32 /DNA_END=1187 /DNA_ORIENTATION=-
MPSPHKHGGSIGRPMAPEAVGAAVGATTVGARAVVAVGLAASADKLPPSPSGGSAASTAVGLSHLLDDTEGVPPSSVSPEEALTMNQCAPHNPAQGVATVRVSCRSGNWICGRLEFGNLPTEDVAFTTIKVEPVSQPEVNGHKSASTGIKLVRVFVGDVAAGPDYFRKISWILKSVNGCACFEPAWITSDDCIVLEGPRCVIERQCHSSSITTCGSSAHVSAAEPPVLGARTEIKGPNPCNNLSCCSGPLAQEDTRLRAFLGALEESAARPKMLPGGLAGLLQQGSKDDFDLVLATRATAARSSPIVPRLDLSNMQSRKKNSRRHGQGLFDLCDGFLSVQDSGATPGLADALHNGCAFERVAPGSSCSSCGSLVALTAATAAAAA